MDNKDIDLYLSGRKKETLKRKIYFMSIALSIAIVLAHSIGLLESNQFDVYLLAFCVVFNAFLYIAPWEKPRTCDLLNIIEKQINNDPELIEKVANRNSPHKS